jgi:hypothetical protein
LGQSPKSVVMNVHDSATSLEEVAPRVSRYRFDVEAHSVGRDAQRGLTIDMKLFDEGAIDHDPQVVTNWDKALDPGSGLGWVRQRDIPEA